MEPPAPIDLGYIKCDPCIDERHDDCIGRKVTRPFCGCRCPWTVRAELDPDWPGYEED